MKSGMRIALITGASSGIGAAIARVLADQGYRLALLARREQQLAELASELRARSDVPHLVLPCDLRRELDLEASFKRLTQVFGRLDLLVNNAGIGLRARIEESEPEHLRALFDTNVIAPMLACRAALPLLRKSERAVVINIASVVGRRGIPGQAAYCASKAALVSLGEALRVEWTREHIEVCTLNPGLTATGFFEAQVNPSHLAAPDLTRSDGPAQVARVVLELDRHPRPEVSLRRKWHVLALLSLIAPRWSDRLLARRIGGVW